jgi:hypothetical protein
MLNRLWLVFILAARGAAAAPAAPAAEGPPPRMSVCECVTNRICWGVAKTAFALIVSTKKREVEGALPGRFFPGTQTATLHRPDKNGHFLRVTRGSDRVSFESARDLLEQRLAFSSLVQSVSPEPESALFSPTTWALTGAGDAAQQEAKRCRPGLWSELAPTLTSGS